MPPFSSAGTSSTACPSLPGSGSQTRLSPPEPGRTEDCPEPAHPRRGFSHSPEGHRGQNLGLALISGGAGGRVWRAGGRRTLMQQRRRYDWASGPAASGSVIGLSCLLAQVPELGKGRGRGMELGAQGDPQPCKLTPSFPRQPPPFSSGKQHDPGHPQHGLQHQGRAA